jgi:hypothetical protein
MPANFVKGYSPQIINFTENQEGSSVLQMTYALRGRISPPIMATLEDALSSFKYHREQLVE